MKTIFKIITVAFLFFLSNTLSAQTFKNIENDDNLSSFNAKHSQESFFLNQESKTKSIGSKTNAVFINQIGSNNTLISATKSLESDINVVQNGEDNLTVLELNSVRLEETVIQNGDNNTFLDYSPFKSDLRSATINQTGNNQNLTIFGANSLSEKIKVSMKGQDQSIIIRNF